jgi:hypothetical protein
MWGLHPVNAEAVGLIHAKGDLLSATLLLLSGLAFDSAGTGSRWTRWHLATALLAFAGALFAKEVAFFVPLFAFAMAAQCRFEPATARAVKRYIVISSLIAALVLVMHGLAAGFPSGPASALPAWERMATFCEIYVGYLQKLCWPVGISIADTTLRASAWSLARGLFVAFVFSGTVALQGWWWRRASYARVWIALFNLSLLPVCQLVPLLHFRSERFLYIPSLAFVGGVLDFVRRRMPLRSSHVARVACRCALAATIVAFACIDRSRIRTFGSDPNLFGPEIARTPDYLEGLSVLGSHYDRLGDFRRAEELFRDALRPRPRTISYLDYDGAILGLSHSLLAQGRALEVIALVHARLPEMTSARYADELRYNAGVAAYKMNRFNESLSVLEPYGKIHQNDVDCAILTGMAAIQVGRFELAKGELERYLALSPTAPDRSDVEGVLRHLPPR